MIPGITGLSTPMRAQCVDEVEVVMRLEEELRDREVGLCELLGAVTTVRLDRRRARMRLRMHGHADREVADGPGEADELDGVMELTLGELEVGGRIPAQSEDVLDPGVGVALRTIVSSSARVCAAQVRCAIAVIRVSRLMRTTISWVRSRVVPPAP